MIDGITISAETSLAAAKFVEKHGEYITSTINNILQNVSESILIHSRHGYRKFLENSIELNSKSRSFFYRSSPVPIYDFFVPMDVEYSSSTIEAANIADLLEKNIHLVIQASAGYGKSTFLRHLFLTSLETCNFIPVLLDLRKITEENQSLLDFIHSKMYSYGFNQDLNFLMRGLELGHFLFLLDGFDEINLNRRKKISEEIVFLASKFNKSPIIVTSRPDDIFSSWDNFEVLKLSPLTRDTAIELVKKTPEEDGLKSKFIKDLETSLFDSHDTFLRNPLLLSIMVVTYNKSANVPAKISLFYDYAYQALFEGHDASKGGFQRERRCDLDILDFSRVFSSFCIQTYSREEYTIPKIRAHSAVEKAIKDQNRDNVATGDFLEDCLQSVCLLVEEGLDISFSHRSFQEYFVAKFVANSPDDTKDMLIKRLTPFAQFDSVLPILWEIDEFAFEKYYLIPTAKSTFEKIGVKDKVGHYAYVRYVKLVFDEFICENEGGGVSFQIKHHPSVDYAWKWLDYVDVRYFGKRRFGSFNMEDHKRLMEICKNDLGIDTDSGVQIKLKDVPAKSKFWKVFARSNFWITQNRLSDAMKIYLEIKKNHRQRKNEILDLIEI